MRSKFSRPFVVSSFRLFFIFLLTSLPSAFPAQVQTYDQLIHAIREVRHQSDVRIEQAVDQEKVREAWETGKLIDEHVLLHKERADYGKQVIVRLSKDLEMGDDELYRMLEFARAYPILERARKLSWSHYMSLLSIHDEKERNELAEKAEEEHWTRDRVREEVRKHKVAKGEKETVSEKLSEMIPGPLSTYSIIRLKDRLKIDLGFGVYQDVPEKDIRKFKDGNWITIEKGKLKKTENKPSFTYSAMVTQIVDGDTFYALIDLGFGITLAERVRLRRIDTPEILTAAGKEAKSALEKILSRDQGRILLQSHELDQHGRPLADIWVQGKSIDQELLDQGLATIMTE